MSLDPKYQRKVVSRARNRARAFRYNYTCLPWRINKAIHDPEFKWEQLPQNSMDGVIMYTALIHYQRKHKVVIRSLKRTSPNFQGKPRRKSKKNLQMVIESMWIL